MVPLILIGTLVVLVALVFNQLVRMRNRVDNAWSDVDVQLKRRWDLVPRLQEVARGYAGFERRVLDDLTKARAEAESADLTPDARAAAEANLAGRIRSVVGLMEAYPDLKASAQFQRLQRELAALEADVVNARDYYNAVVRDYNTLAESVPTNLVARAGGFRRAAFFSAGDEERGAPRVEVTS